MEKVFLHMRLAFGGFLFFLSVTACSKDYNFDFSQGGEQVVVTVNAQDDLVLRPMQAIYRSTVCTFTDYRADGSEYERDGYNNVVKHAERIAGQSVYRQLFDVYGGGACQWQLSNLTFGVDYKSPERFASDFIVAGAGGVIVMFDENRPPQSGPYTVVSGELTIKEEYYLSVADREARTPRFNVGLLAEDDLFLSYKAKEARVIHFEPRLHSDYVVYSSFLKREGYRRDQIFIYPNGEVIQSDRVRPDFNKMQCIRDQSLCSSN